MAAAINTPVEHLLLAPGSELLIRLLPTVLSVGRVCVASRSYGDHANAWGNAEVRLTESIDPLEEAGGSDAVVVCNPNNPDGRRWPIDRLRETRRALADKRGWLIIDEAYADLDPEQSMVGDGGRDGLIVLRSFGKFFGLAGVRLGAMVAPPSVRAAMNERLGVWPVAGPTLTIGTEAYGDIEWQIDTRRTLSAARGALDAVLQKRGLDVVGGTDLYRFVRVADARAVWRGLAERGIYVRRFDWCNRHLRIGLPTSDKELQRLSEALGEVTP